MMRRRLRVLVTVYSANPAAQSEPLNGYKFARELHRVADVKVIAHARDRADISKTELAGDVIYAGSARLANTLRRIGYRVFGTQTWHLLNALDFFDYLAYDLDALRIGLRLRRTFPYDLVHRVTPTTIRFPTTLWRLGVPLVTGPHCGGMSWPPGFAHLGRRERTVDWMRPAGGVLHRLFRDLEGAWAILIGADSCRRVIPGGLNGRVRFMCQNGVDRLPAPSPWAGDPDRLLFVGRLVPFKCPDLAVRALARLPKSVCLTIVGDGPEHKRLEETAASLGVAARIRFVGWVPQRRTAQYYGEAGVFVYPSVRESTGAVILEAMAHGLPVVAADWGGPAAFLKGGCGILLPVDGLKQLEDGIVRAVEWLRANPGAAREMGQRARQRVVDEYLWPQKAQRLLGIYDEVLNGQAR